MATIVVPKHFSIQEDAETIRKACEGWGTDEKAIIAVLGHRNAVQRKQIRQAYEDLYQEDLVKCLEKELSGDFERAVYRWILDPADRDAVLANVELRKSSDEHPVLVEISCTRSPEELLCIRRAYHARYKRSLEEEVSDKTKGETRQLLVGLVTAFRYDGDEVNTKLAKSEAEELHEAIKDKKFNHEDVIKILTTRSKMQLQATFNCYREAQGSSIAKNLPTDAKEEYVATLRVAIRCLKDSKKYFEKVLRNSLKRLGTDEDAITRVIVTRAEKDLKDIKEVYQKRNSMPLEEAVDNCTSGDYKDMLLSLLGNEL
ncbi:hypothetical protein GQ457_09G015130 [Hibiscus cannabinus]